METVLNIFLLLLYVCLMALSISLIIYIKKIVVSIEEVNKDIKSVVDKLDPLIDSMKSMSGSLQQLSGELSDQLEKTGWIIDEVKIRVESLLNFEDKVKGTLESPMPKLIQNIVSIKNGFSVFWQALFSGKTNSKK